MKLDSELSVLDSQLNQRQQEVTEIQSKMGDINRVIALAREEMNMIKPLVDRGSAPKRDLLQMEQNMAQHNVELNGLKAALPRARSAVTEAQARRDDATTQFRATAQAELSQTQIEMQTIGQTLSGLEDRKNRTEIRSPVDGIVKDLKINTVGGVVKPGDDVVEIVPSDDQLVVEARIRPADIAFIYPGQRAMVKLTAYDFAIYGGLPAEVVDISADTITNERGESFYRVKVRTNKTTLKHNGQELPIIPGMVATVDILTGERTVMEYMLKPFIKTIDSAMNER
jgi:adhesin transport system membrane fusion protein